MILSKLTGGLGNQLFQYAAGRTLALLNQTELKLDLSAYEADSLRGFALQHFPITAGIATADEINNLLPATIRQKICQYMLPVHKRTYYRERYFHFDKNFFRLGNPVYLNGYFQSEKYFLPAKEILLKEFSFTNEIIEPVENFSMELKNKNSVSVHLRRGDYAHDPVSTAYHGVLDATYYRQAADLLLSRFPDASFYLFTDDAEWAQTNFRLPQATLVSGHFSHSPLQDLYLMSQCRHQIIANSSFSWWGAWLNPHPGKLVISPRKWFRNGPADTHDLYPPTWIIL